MSARRLAKHIQLYKNSYALVIGNGNYTNDWDPLNGALTDVEEVETLLKKHGFHVTLKKDLTKAQFDRAFAEFVLKSGEDVQTIASCFITLVTATPAKAQSMKTLDTL